MGQGAPIFLVTDPPVGAAQHAVHPDFDRVDHGLNLAEGSVAGFSPRQLVRDDLLQLKDGDVRVCLEIKVLLDAFSVESTGDPDLTHILTLMEGLVRSKPMHAIFLRVGE